jgi:hypothetical protein
MRENCRASSLRLCRHRVQTEGPIDFASDLLGAMAPDRQRVSLRPIAHRRFLRPRDILASLSERFGRCLRSGSLRGEQRPPCFGAACTEVFVRGFRAEVRADRHDVSP